MLNVPWTNPPVERICYTDAMGSTLSAVQWFEGEPELVFLHGGGQNAHTWDAIALLLARPMIAFDLPGHGHSDWSPQREYWPVTNAERIAAALDAFQVRPRGVIGMSLGGLTAIRLSSVRPDLAPKTVVIDVTPSQTKRNQSMTEKDRGTTALTQGARSFASLEEMIAVTRERAPSRPALLLERGVVNNARQLDDGSWTWRYDELSSPGGEPVDFSDLWADVEHIDRPVLLVLGGDSAFVHPEDREQFQLRSPDLRVECVAGAGHAVQSDRPVELAEVLRSFLM